MRSIVHLTLIKTLLSVSTLILISTFSLPSFASHENVLDGTEAVTYSADEYRFPDLPGDMSTICSAVLHVPKAESQEFNIQVRKDLPETAQIRRRAKLKLRYYPAPQPTNKVLLVLSGLGADTTSIFSKFYAQKAQAAGYHAIVFPNTLTDDFILSTSSQGLIGDTHADSYDLLLAISTAVEKLKTLGVVQPELKVLGFSHGALLAAAVDKISTDLKEAGRTGVNIGSVLLVNPPVDLLFGLRNIDGRAAAAKKIPFFHLVDLGLRFQKFVAMFQKSPTTPENFYKFAKELNYADREAYAIIGYVMQKALGPAIFASQMIDNLDVLPALETRPGDTFHHYEVRGLRQRAAAYGYESYFNEFFGARAKREGTSARLVQMNENASLPAYEQHLRDSKKIYLLHNADDLLLRPEDTRWLADIFRGRAQFFPRGGHMGNIWFPRNIEFFENWLKK